MFTVEAHLVLAMKTDLKSSFLQLAKIGLNQIRLSAQGHWQTAAPGAQAARLLHSERSGAQGGCARTPLPASSMAARKVRTGRAIDKPWRTICFHSVSISLPQPNASNRRALVVSAPSGCWFSPLPSWKTATAGRRIVKTTCRGQMGRARSNPRGANCAERAFEKRKEPPAGRTPAGGIFVPMSRSRDCPLFLFRALLLLCHKVNGALRMAGGGKDRALIVLQHFQP